MKNKIIIFLIFGLQLLTCRAQKQPVIYDIKKGEVLDVLFVITKPDSVAQEKQQRYFNEVFPVGAAAGFKSLPFLRIGASPFQGNFHPSAFAPGTWASLEARQSGMRQVEAKIPDIHERRRDIWSVFAMTYYVMNEDLYINFNPTKMYVITTLWVEKPDDLISVQNDHLNQIKKFNGKPLMILKDGKSPIGLYYNPDLLTISEWNGPNDFQAYLAQNRVANDSKLKNINQFVINLY